MLLLYFCRLLEDGICNDKNIPSISSINRVIRDKAILQRRSLDSATSLENLTLPSTYSVSSSDQEEVNNEVGSVAKLYRKGENSSVNTKLCGTELHILICLSITKILSFQLSVNLVCMNHVFENKIKIYRTNKI